MPRSSPLEHLTLRARPARRLAFEAGALLNRGYAELKPKKVNHPKVAATAVRQIVFKSRLGVAGAVLLMPATGQEADQALQLLPDLPRVTLGAAVLPALLDQLAQAGERTVICLLGDGETPRGEAHAALARSLAAHNPQIEQQLAEELHARMQDGTRTSSSSPYIDNERLVVEEKPGKALVLSLGDTTLRLALKRWQALASRAPEAAAKQPVEAPDGWGVGAFVVEGPPKGQLPQSKTARVVQVASLDVQMAGEAVDLDTGRRLASLANTWLLDTAGLPLGAMRRVVLSVPWMAVASAVGQAFTAAAAATLTPGPKPELVYPDLVHGWQPFLSLMETLYMAELPALYVCTGRYPEVHLAAVWP